MKIFLLSLVAVILSWSVTVQAESAAYKDFTFFQFEDDNWEQTINKGTVQVEYKCDEDDVDVGCFLEVYEPDVRYLCADGAVLILLANGILLVPKECDIPG